MEDQAVSAEAKIMMAASKKEALDHAIAAAELYLKALGLASSNSERGRLRNKCTRALEKAEEIKALEEWPPSKKDQQYPSATVQELEPPVSNQVLAPDEELILMQSSHLNGAHFPPWKATPKPGEFEIEAPGELYTDYTDLQLSPSQREKFAGWKRPREGLSQQLFSQDLLKQVLPTMSDIGGIDLVQDVTADCSVVASLCAIIARPGNKYGKLLSSIFHPFDTHNCSPAISSNGKYIFRLQFNGCPRQVVIDDRIPTSNTNRTLHVVDRRNPGLLWPALLEKAYLKVRGGYDFPGSNSCTDLWVLTGWIPEQVFLQSDELPLDDLWQRAYKSFGFGDVMVTLGTGRLTTQEEEALGLAGKHDYAVLDFKQVGPRRFLHVKNPWCDGAIWTGSSISSKNPETRSSFWTPELQEALSHTSAASPLGTFWITFDEVIRHFDSLYFNWNPGLFRHRQDRHFSWTIPQSTTSQSFVQNPQFAIRSAVGGSVWIVLSRHFSTDEHQLDVAAERATPSVPRSLGYISLYTFDLGRRAYLSDEATFRGPYVDSPQILAKLDMENSSCYTVVVAQQRLPLPKYSFTLSVYSREPVTVQPAFNQYSICKSLTGEWTSLTSGGNTSAATYPHNPQYKLSIPSTTDIHLLIETERADLSVHVKLVWTGGDRINTVATKDILGDSGDYRRGCAVAQISKIPAGSYIIVCSTFEPGQTGRFKLRVESMVPFEVQPLASEAAGLLSLRLPLVSFSGGVDRVLTPLFVPSITRVTIIARHPDRKGLHFRSISKSPLKLTLERGQGPHKAIIATSGDGNFSYATAGIRIQKVNLSPEPGRRGGVWLALERLGDKEALDEVEVEILTERILSFGPWGTGEG